MQDRIRGNQTGKQVGASRNIRLILAFDGTAYHGWQIQADQPTVQEAVRAAIERITAERVALSGSGRTDAGTHARMLVASFFTSARLAPQAWRRALNSTLPPDIRVLAAARVPPGFHARWDAKSKIYRYQIYRGEVLPPHLAREHYHFPYPLDAAAMRQACALFTGEHDFASFAARSGKSGRKESRTVDGGSAGRGTVRRIFSCSLAFAGRRLVFTVEGDGFLHHMVRNMVGTLLEVGRGRMTLEEFRALFQRGDRSLAGCTVPAHGLILLRVRYGKGPGRLGSPSPGEA